MYEIKTTSYIKERKVLLDGMTVTIRPLGAGSELTIGQTQRRLTFLEKKIKAGTITEQELDKYDALEEQLLDYFDKFMLDGTEDNHKVRAWLKETPYAVIQQVFEDMKKQFDEAEAEEQKDGATAA